MTPKQLRAAANGPWADHWATQRDERLATLCITCGHPKAKHGADGRCTDHFTLIADEDDDGRCPCNPRQD